MKLVHTIVMAAAVCLSVSLLLILAAFANAIGDIDGGSVADGDDNCPYVYKPGSSRQQR